VSYGRALGGEWPGEGPWAVVDGTGGLLAVYERAPDGRIKAAVVLAPALSPGSSPN
jgi:hypothetical protein